MYVHKVTELLYNMLYFTIIHNMYKTVGSVLLITADIE